jgi:hypothetical protein
MGYFAFTLIVMPLIIPFRELACVQESSMVLRLRLGLIALCVACPTLAQSAQDRPVSGNVYLVPNTTDPTVYVTLKGAGALQMYNSMQVKAVDDACRGGGRKYKLAGNVACSVARDGKSAVCDFGLNLKSGTASVGQPC